ncbi:MAG: serine/threonine-protein kinase [Acidobacteriota bacterium]
MTLKTIRHYRVLEQLDGGPPAQVYKAEDGRDGHLVAIKFLPFELKEDPEAKERFVAEAQAASSLDHPNICRVEEIGEAEDGRMYAALTYYEGRTLGRVLEKGPLEMEYVLDVARQIAAGLGEAHRHGLVHRDLVPSNVLLSGDGQAWILDFGLGKQVSQGGLTQIGWSFGTPEYMSPELIRGATPDATADLWSLGVLLYEMISGSRPFTGPNLAGILTAIQQHDPPSLRESRPETPPALDTIIRRLLAKDPDDRYASCEELQQDLGEPGSEPQTVSLLPVDIAAAQAEDAADPRAVDGGGSAAEEADAAAKAPSSDRTLVLAVLALLAAVFALWLLLAGSADGSLAAPGGARAVSQSADLPVHGLDRLGYSTSGRFSLDGGSGVCMAPCSTFSSSFSAQPGIHSPKAMTRPPRIQARSALRRAGEPRSTGVSRTTQARGGGDSPLRQMRRPRISR